MLLANELHGDTNRTASCPTPHIQLDSARMRPAHKKYEQSVNKVRKLQFCWRWPWMNHTGGARCTARGIQVHCTVQHPRARELHAVMPSCACELHRQPQLPATTFLSALLAVSGRTTCCSLPPPQNLQHREVCTAHDRVGRDAVDLRHPRRCAGRPGLDATERGMRGGEADLCRIPTTAER